MKFRLTAVACGISAVLMAGALGSTAIAHSTNSHPAHHQAQQRYFERVATFPVYLNSDINIDTVAEIVSASEDGNTLVYTDGVAGKIGFVDITDAENPQPLGSIDVGGEPTSVAVAGNYVLAAVNTSPSYEAPTGKLVVININTHAVKTEIDLGGQPDSIAVSPDKRYAAIAMENERDEDLGDGRPPQAPAGFLNIIDLKGNNPANWGIRSVSMTGITDLFPEDPEPEFVDINKFNVAAISLQENNHIAFVYLPTGKILNDWSAGTVDLTEIDIEENDFIELNGSLTSVPREPDGLAWVSPFHVATADEGDLDGGSRGFTVFDFAGNTTYEAGNSLEHIVTRLGHYPESRSENKGNEPENIEYGQFGSERFIFVASERSSVVYVYQVQGAFGQPELVQVLPAALGPEGLLAIPQRGLLVAAGEEDSRSDGFRGSLTIYKFGAQKPAYPTVYSTNDENDLPIAWSALSALSADPVDTETVYTLSDSFYRSTRIYPVNVGQTPAVIQQPIFLNDRFNYLAAVAPDMVEGDGRVNLDGEGIASRKNGGFWIASEGAGSVNDASRPVTSQNLLIKAAADGAIEQVVQLPASANNRQIRFGFEGVATTGDAASEVLFVAFQRSWVDDPAGMVRIGRYDTASAEWTFFYYPLDAVESPNGGWIGLSEITALNDEEFVVIERDNQANTDAAVKRLYRFSVAGLTALADPAAGVTPEFSVVEKTLVRDVLPDLQATKGAVLEKIEGFTVLSDGTGLLVNDNDGVDDSNGETQLIRFDELF